jgi:uncharacterized protein
VSGLADRIRGIVAPHSAATGRDPEAGPASPAVPAEPDHLETTLGGEWKDADGGRCFVVETRVPAATMHGRARVGEIRDRLEETARDAPMIAGGAPARSPFLFVDLETTGLAGGAGTYAFLVGCGRFVEDGAFEVRQFLLTRFADERPLLSAVRGELARAGALVSFNGKSFDAPLLETRYLFHRLEWIGRELPHVDVLHPARRFWGAAGESASGNTPPCSLTALEWQVLGAHRRGDVPGFEIPARYFRFVRNGDSRPLAAVLEHNRLDLLSLAGLTTRLLYLVRVGGEAAGDAREALALGAIYARAGLDGRACDAYSRALALAGSRAGSPSFECVSGSLEPVRVTALRALALICRRARRYADAARYWEQLLQVRGCPRHLSREATEALAIHHEHRVRDLERAKAFALRSLEAGPAAKCPAWTNAVHHRLARIERKMQTSGLPLAFPPFPS